jgi:hypothetical protein
MPRNYPQRPREHELETCSRRFFERHLPSSWICRIERPDYGVDLRVEIFDGGQATSLDFIVQLKASDVATQEEYEVIQLRTVTYRYLWDMLQVVLLVKYVFPDDEAYYILLKDVPAPDQENDTFTIRVPKSNRLSGINWESIKQYVSEVRNRKVAAHRMHVEQQHTTQDSQ